MGFFSRSKWRRHLRGADYTLAAKALSAQFAGSVIPDQLAALLTAFVRLPNSENAIALLEFDSQFITVFESCKPGGLFTRLPPESLFTTGAKRKEDD